MAEVNQPQFTPPRKWLSDPDLSADVQELYYFLFQLWQRTGGGQDIVGGNNEQIEINTININSNTDAIEANTANVADALNGFQEWMLSADDFQAAFSESVQGADYTTTGNEIIKLSADVRVTLNPEPSDNERVYVKSTGKGFSVWSVRKIDGHKAIRYNKPYGGYWFSYSLELDTWSIL